MPEEIDSLFDKLFIDEALDKELLAKLALPYVQIVRTEGKILFTPEWDELTLAQKVLCYLLARKILRVAELIEQGKESVTPKEIEEDTRIPGNSLRPTLKRLLEQQIVTREESDGSTFYLVEDHQLRKVEEELPKRNG